MRDVFFHCHEVDQVTSLHGVVTARDDGLAFTQYGNYVVGQFLAQFSQGLVEYLGVVTQFDSHHDKGTACKFPPLTYPAEFHSVNDVLGGQHLGIDE